MTASAKILECLDSKKTKDEKAAEIIDILLDSPSLTSLSSEVIEKLNKSKNTLRDSFIANKILKFGNEVKISFTENPEDKKNEYVQLGRGGLNIEDLIKVPNALYQLLSNGKPVKLTLFNPQPDEVSEDIQTILNYLPKDYYRSKEDRDEFASRMKYSSRW